jgi:CheY-like chemotaxis protein/HPt (histidine-containing phosphotransfer) domain-containing protein
MPAPPAPPHDRSDAAADLLDPAAPDPLFVLVAAGPPEEREATRALLVSLGEHVELSPEGRSVLEAAADAAPDVLVTDAHVPYGALIDALRHLHQALPRAITPFVIALAEGAPPEERRALGRACEQVLPKPVSREALAPVLARAREESYALDGETLRGLEQLLGDRAGASEMLDELFDKTAAVLAQLGPLLAHDRATARHLAHSLVGSAGACGAYGLARAALGVERAIVRARAGEIEPRLRRLRVVFARTMGRRSDR